jgi:hypothetical protein
MRTMDFMAAHDQRQALWSHGAVSGQLVPA